MCSKVTLLPTTRSNVEDMHCCIFYSSGLSTLYSVQRFKDCDAFPRVYTWVEGLVNEHDAGTYTMVSLQKYLHMFTHFLTPLPKYERRKYTVLCSLETSPLAESVAQKILREHR